MPTGKLVLTPFVLGLLFGVVAHVQAADGGRFIETVTQKKGDATVTTRQMCLKDQSLKIEDDVVAIINKTNGKVMADRGKGFAAATAGTKLKENNRVVTLDEATTEIVFFDCCKTALKENNLITIKANPGCKVAVMDAAPVQAAPAATSAAPPPSSPVAQIHPFSYVPPFVGGALIFWAISDATNGFGSY